MCIRDRLCYAWVSLASLSLHSCYSRASAVANIPCAVSKLGKTISAGTSFEDTNVFVNHRNEHGRLRTTGASGLKSTQAYPG
eukprot:10164598-Alexandrium_andersonii.AAC.1